MNASGRAAARFTPGLQLSICSVTALKRYRVDLPSQVRTDKLQPVIDAALLAAERGCGP
jgi:hypothetical protein